MKFVSGGGAAVSLIALALGCPAAAQQAGPKASSERPIVVTGTLLKGGREAGPAPVALIDAEDLADQGSPTMVELIKRMPGSAGVLGDAAQFDIRSQFNEGVASINLRGLGPQRTLVLFNGKRVVPMAGGTYPAVDVNLLPVAALGRIEVLKDGAAATYGSDAIAGVVNLITRTDQAGLRASADYRYVPGSRGDWTGALSWGGLFGPMRLFVAGGYQHRSELVTTDRAWALKPYEANPQGGWSGGGSPGNFDFNGPVGGTRFDADKGCAALGGFRSLPGSSADLCLTNYLQFTNLTEPEDRYQLFVDAAIDLTPAATLRLTGLYGRTDTVLTTSPSYLPTIAPSANAAFGGAGLFTVPAYAPALADYCARFGAAAGCSLDANGQPNQPALAFPVRFRPVLLGGNPLFANPRHAAVLPRTSDLYRLTADLTYHVSSTVDLAVSGTYSGYDRYFEGGDSFVDLLQNALAGFGGETCAYAAPQARAGLSQTQLAAVAGKGGCHYFNPFSTGIAGNAVTGIANPGYAGTSNPLGLSLTPGAGLINDASTLGDFYTVINRQANTAQWVGDAVLSGETGLRLPGGPASFALGAQYRRDEYSRLYGATNNLAVFPCAGSVLNPAAMCNPQTGPIGFLGSNRDARVASGVWAAFAELRLPLAERIEAQLSARYEDYGGQIGGTFDPQARVRIGLTEWLGLRGGVGTTFRAPPPQATSANLVVPTLIGSSFRAVDVIGNPALKPERATTWNAGVLVNRGGLRANVDYWRYDFSRAIENEPVSGIVSALFGATGSAHCGDPAYAALQARFTFSGGTCATANVQRLTTYAFNSADVTTSGVDFQATYDTPIGPVRASAGVSGTYVIDYRVGAVTVEGIAVQPAFDAAGKLNYQTTAYPLPQWKGQAWVQGKYDAHTLRLQVNYVDGYTDQRVAEFGPNASALAGASVTAGKQIVAFTTVDLAWRWRLPTGTEVSAALFNLLDQDPPFARLDQNYDPFTASALGVTAKVGVSQAF
ncbi:MAG: TonB-dependent receptor [Croceibacterium sp.]